ncbi:helix-turn-helix domain-containing protein [Halobacillus campisalis]|uniref:Helix-turn-helix domain-containing protein n=1 Tax=Halobacillus campisalis TaxID=435909 RepID=A0ABW2KA56_9BACI|nr:helix-turn-helix transcriptional regulator [Halobacillus campisalis]
MSIQDRVIQCRERKGWSQRELANRVSINYSVLNRIELATRPIKDQELNNLANVLDVSADYLLGRSDTPNLSEEQKFEVFKNNPELERWYYELPRSDEEDLEQLREMWEIIKRRKK